MFETLKKMIANQTKAMKKVDEAALDVALKTADLLKANEEAMKRIRENQMKASC